MGALLRSPFRIALLLVIVLLAACGSSMPGNGEPPPVRDPDPPVIPGPPIDPGPPPDPVPPIEPGPPPPPIDPGPPVDPGPPDEPEPPEEPEPPDVPPPGIKAIVDLVNEFRARPRTCGTQVMPAVAPVAWHDNLELAARRHSEYMAETGIFSHVGRGGTNVAQRARSAGYDWSWIGENIAYGYPTVADVHRGWANSPGHCMNLMQPFAVHVGVARAYSDNGVPYWTQVLARPS